MRWGSGKTDEHIGVTKMKAAVRMSGRERMSPEMVQVTSDKEISRRMIALKL